MNQGQHRPETEVDAGEDLAEFDIDAVPQAEPADPLTVAPVLAVDDPLRDFSGGARERYQMEVGAFAAELHKQSLAHKRSRAAETVSGSDVVAAVHFLRSYRPSGYSKYVAALGGLLIGLGAQSLGSMVASGAYTTGGVLWGAGTAVAGVALLVWHAARSG